jgi:hypothetical protein
MNAAEYQFLTKWEVPGDIRAVYDILYDVARYPEWWPSLAQSFHATSKGDATGVGAKGDIITKGFLPYVIRWSYEVVATDRPNEFSIIATGDLIGNGHWSLQQKGESVEIVYRWNVRTEKLLLRLLSPILRPLFAWNHNWVMARGREGLLKELNS